MWVFQRTEPGLFTVGFFGPDGRWRTDTDHETKEAAAARVHYLNGGGTADPDLLAACKAALALESSIDTEAWYASSQCPNTFRQLRAAVARGEQMGAGQDAVGYSARLLVLLALLKEMFPADDRAGLLRDLEGEPEGRRVQSLPSPFAVGQLRRLFHLIESNDAATDIAE